MHVMTSRTLYLLVTCCVEETRFNILKQVISNIKEEQITKNFNIEDQLVVFDNGSTHPGTVELLKQNFKTVFQSSTNEGFWSAINWILKIIDQKFDYIYVIESDHIHFALERVSDIEQFLDDHPDVGGVRAQEFVIAERHLYNKSKPVAGSRTYAWVNQIHHQTKKPIFITESDSPGFFITNFLSQLHSVNRVKQMKKVFQVLESMSTNGKFSEFDYQVLYNADYPIFGVIDGGLFHAKLSWDNGTVAGSYCGPAAKDNIGYQETRISTITPPEKMNVKYV